MSQTEMSSDSKSSNEKSDNVTIPDVEYQLVRQLKNRHIAMIRRVEISLMCSVVLINCSRSVALEVLLEQVHSQMIYRLDGLLTTSRSFPGHCGLTSEWGPVGTSLKYIYSCMNHSARVTRSTPGIYGNWLSMLQCHGIYRFLL
jgi:hypothetical protein